MITHDVIRARLLRQCGLAESSFPKQTLANLERSEWSPRFEMLMRNRLIMGALRYGVLGAANKPQYDRVGSMERRLRQYVATGNTELLVDVANLCLCEFVEGKHPNRHFHSIDDGDHVVQRSA